MKGTVRFAIWWLKRQLLVSLGILLAYFVITKVLFSANVSTSNVFLNNFGNMIAGIVAFLLPWTWFLEGKHLAFSMGATRKEFFLAGQMHKLPAVLISLMFLLLAGQRGLPVVSGAVSAFAAACMSECMGIWSCRMGRKGLILFTIMAGLFGGLGGALGSIGVFQDIGFVLQWIQNPLLPWGSLLLSAVLLAVSWQMFRKMDV